MTGLRGLGSGRADVGPPRRSRWDTRRYKPYTEAGLQRVKCVRCGHNPASTQWQVCADGNVYRPLCRGCDVQLNQLVLEWARHPDANRLMRKYRGWAVQR